jgi:hypothetical protein
MVTKAHAEPAKGITTPAPHAIAPRGGVLLLPLQAQRPGDQWPDTIDVHLDNGGVLRGKVAWFMRPEADPAILYDPQRTWTGNPDRLVVRPVQPTDDTSVVGSGTPYLVARLPLEGNGAIRIGGRTVPTSWFDLPPTTDAKGPILHRIAAPDRPDPDSPLQYWRWVLLAEQLNRIPPGPPSSNELEGLVALHTAEVWRLALARLDEADPNAAASVRHLLTATCRDGSRTIACWVADAGRLSELLTYLHDTTSDPSQMLRFVGAWIEREPDVVWWPAVQYGNLVRIDMINRGHEPALVSFRWTPDDIPIAVLLEPQRLERTQLQRPPLPKQNALTGKRDTIPADELLIEVAGKIHRVQTGRRLAMVRPPGLLVGPLAAPLTLRGALQGMLRQVPVDRTTFVQLRQLHGRWEAFFDCRRPRGANVTLPDADDGPLADLRGRESVTLMLGPSSADGGPSVFLTVPESGWHELPTGTNDGTLEIHRRSFEDRWYARIVLPESWLLQELGEPALMGFVRAHGDCLSLETAPGQSLPWAPAVGRLSVDVTRWNDR